MVGTKGHRGKTPQPDRGRVTERAIDGEAGRLAGEAARDLGNAARAFAFHTLAPLLSPDRRAAVLALGAKGHPVTLEIRLSPPRSIAFMAAGIELARVDFDVLQ